MLNEPLDLLRLSVGTLVSKRELYDLIQYSKVPGSRFWRGLEQQIGNTPQQGINWIGRLPSCHAVIIKTKPGSYAEDGWESESKDFFRYSFKARDKKISYTEKANSVLINQPQYQYPVLLFSEEKNSWIYHGSFSLSAIDVGYVVLRRGNTVFYSYDAIETQANHQEGGRKFVAHLMVERSQAVVNALKSSANPVCEICTMNFDQRYGVNCIEAHHKVPVSTYSGRHPVSADDFSLLCPNCHRAVHVLMRTQGLDYTDIKANLIASGISYENAK